MLRVRFVVERPKGIPIPTEVHEQFPKDVKEAWEEFDAWWKSPSEEGERPSRKNMPADVKEAMNLILETPIPGRTDGATGKDSCYMVHVLSELDGPVETEEEE